MTGRAAAWAQLLRVSALFTVPGDALAGALAAGRAPGRGTALAAGCSLCLYEAGMALNDWADREEDARERPERPLPAGRIRPAAALAAAGALTAAGLTFAARAGRLPLTTATALAATVWAYDLRLARTPAGPATMATARFLDVLLGAVCATAPAAASPTVSTTSPVAASVRALVAACGTASARPPEAATGAASAGALAAVSGEGPAVSRGAFVGDGGRDRRRDGAPSALGAAALMAGHTLAVTAVSRREAEGGAPGVPLAALGAVGAVAAWTARHRTPAAVTASAVYAATAARPLLHAALNPSPPLLQRAVGGGIRAMIPLQAALAARAAGDGRGGAGPVVPVAALLGLLPLARRLSRKVSPT